MIEQDFDSDSKVADEPISDAKIEAVKRGLLDWFEVNGRNLPWRQTRDPYRILVSEVMLQQTQVDRVIPYYHAFLERFPTVEALAEGQTADVIRLWAGLGYNRRAVNLQRTARYVVDELSGVFPRDLARLQELPGVGRYTAGAIACFAFEQPVGFIDTNMRRVLHRLFVGVDVPRPTASDREILDLANRAVPTGDAWSWNQGLIEFGALQCTARKPACVVCPLQRTCRAFPAVQSALAELPKGVRLKQEPAFAGSRRFYRGRIIDALRDASVNGSTNDNGIDLRQLGPLVREDFTDLHVAWLDEIVRGLERDGLARVAEESPAYDTGTPGTVRVKLP